MSNFVQKKAIAGISGDYAIEAVGKAVKVQYFRIWSNYC